MRAASAYRKRGLAKAEPDPEDVAAILSALGLDSWDDLTLDVQEAIKEVFAQAGFEAGGAVEQVVATVQTAPMFDLVNQDAADYAETRGAELVGMKWVGGELVENPNAEMAITETTREQLRAMIQQAIDEGWSAAKLAGAIRDSDLFGAVRANLIARTELAMAEAKGTLSAWRASGVVAKKAVRLSGVHDVPDECDEAAAMGFIPLDQAFPDGSDGPPIHPRCACVLLAQINEEALAA